jgi:hypothetical protein
MRGYCVKPKRSKQQLPYCSTGSTRSQKARGRLRLAGIDNGASGTEAAMVTLQLSQLGRPQTNGGAFFVRPAATGWLRACLHKHMCMRCT